MFSSIDLGFFPTLMTWVIPCLAMKVDVADVAEHGPK